MTDFITPTQADTELVAAIFEEFGALSGLTIEHIRRGLYNGDKVMQMVARHRHRQSHSLPGDVGMLNLCDKPEWIKHRGGANPVAPHHLVEIKHRAGSTAIVAAGAVNWKHGAFIWEIMGTAPEADIVAYRVVNDYKLNKLLAALTPSALSGDAGEKWSSIADELRACSGWGGLKMGRPENVVISSDLRERILAALPHPAQATPSAVSGDAGEVEACDHMDGKSFLMPGGMEVKCGACGAVGPSPFIKGASDAK